MFARLSRTGAVLLAVVVTAGSTAMPDERVASAAAGTAATFVDFTQCANGAPPSESLSCPDSWINGILQGSNSHYREDDVTPQRVIVNVPKGGPSSGRTLTFRYQTRKGTIHAYDSLATWNLTQTAADACAGLRAAVCPRGPESSFPIPDDPTAVTPAGPGASAVTTAHMIPAGAGRQMKMYGGVITGISVPTHDNATGTGDDYATVVVTYRVDTSSARNVMLLFGGHLAAPTGPRGWGAGLGAASISGGPYHIKFEAADGASIGNRDNQIQGAAILFPRLEITKTADDPTVDAGSPMGFTVTVRNTGTGGADNVTLADPLPGGPGVSWSISPAYAGPGTCAVSGTPPAQTLNCSFGRLGAGATVSVHVVSNTTRDSAGTYPNTATARADHVDPVTADAQIVVGAPVLSVVKTADDAQVNSGQPVGFTVTVSSSGAAPATAVTLNDPLPAADGVNWAISPAYAGPGTCSVSGDVGAQVLSCAFGDLASGTTASVHVVSPTTAATSGTLHNVAVARAGNHADVDDDADTTVNAPALTVDKVADDASVSSGDDIGFTMTVTNGGVGTALGATLTDNLPAGTGVDWRIDPAYAGPGTCAITGAVGSQVLGCAFGDLAPAATASVHVLSNTTRATRGTFRNTATVGANNAPEHSDTDSTSVNAPNLQVAKAADDAVVSSGDGIGFTVTVTNSGTGVARAVTLADPLPASDGVTWSLDPNSPNAADCAVSAAPQRLTCSFGDLAAGATRVVRVTSPTTGATSGTLTNTATASALNNPDASATDAVLVQAPAISVLKTAAAASVSAGAPIGFTVAVTNGGPGIARSVTLHDALPSADGVVWTISPSYAGPGSCAITGSAPNQVLGCAFGDLAADETATVSVASSTTRATGGTLDNTATATPTNGAPDSDNARITVLQPRLTVVKTAADDAVSSGEAIAFTVEVSNAGPGTATGVTLSDLLPAADGVSWSISPANTACQIAGVAPSAQTLTCDFGDLAPGTTASVRVVSNTTGATSGTLSNTAVASSSNHADVDDSAAIAVQPPSLSIVKTATPTSVSSGDRIGFTVAVRNAGPGTAFGVVLLDLLPSATGVAWTIAPTYAGPGTCTIDSPTAPQRLSCAFGDLLAGEGASVSVTSSTATDTAGDIANTATVSADNHAPRSDDATVTVLQPDLDVVKTADRASVSSGEAIGFTVTVTNNGTGVARAATLRDALPAASGVDWTLSAYAGPGSCRIDGAPPTETLACELGDLAPGGTATVRVTSATTEATTGQLRNTAVARSANHDPVDSTAVVVTVNQPNLSVIKTADDSAVSAGDTIGFSIAVTVGGPGTAFGVTLDDPLPTGTGLDWSLDDGYTGPCAITGSGPAQQSLHCAYGDLTPGTTVSVHLSSPTATGTSGTFANTATADATNSPPVTATDQVVVAQPSLVLVKTADDAQVNAGSDVGFTVSVRNTGSGTARQVTISDPLPQGAGLSWTITPAYAGPGTCTIAGPTLSCAIGDLAPGQSASVHVSSPTTFDTPDRLTNTAVAKASNSPDATDTAVVTVHAPALSVVKTPDSAVVSSGDAAGFTVTVRNDGSGNATGVSLNDPLPAIPGSAWQIDPAVNGCAITGDPGTQTLACTIGTLAPGATFSVHVVTPTAGTASGTFRNTALVRATNHPPVEGSGDVTVNPPGLTVLKTADDAEVSSGEAIGFTIVVGNTGPGVARSAVLDDALPSATGVVWTLAGVSTGSCAISGAAGSQALHCEFGDLAEGASSTIRVTSPTTTGTAGVLRNTAVARAANSPDITSTATIQVVQPTLSIRKTADDASVSAGEDIGFSIVVSNGGPGTAFDVVLSDPLPAGAGLSWAISPTYAGPGTCAVTGSAPQTLSCSFGDLAPLARAVVHVTSPTTGATSGTFRNTATARASNHDPVTDSADVTVLAPSLTMTKVADAAAVNAGQPIGFTINVVSGGPGTAFDVTLNDPLPGGTGVSWSIDPAYAGPGTCAVTGTAPTQTLSCAFGDLASGARASVHVLSQTTTATKGTFRNVARLAASNHGDVLAEDTVLVRRPDLVVAKTSCTDTAVPGGQLGYTVTYGNTGDAPAVDAVLTDTLPAGAVVLDAGGGVVSADGRTITWAVGTIAQNTEGLSQTFTVSVPVVAHGTVLTNTVTLSSPTARPATATDETTVITTGAAGDARAFGVEATLLGGTAGIAATPDSDVKNPDAQAGPLAVAGTVEATVLGVVESGGVTAGSTSERAVATVAEVVVTVTATGAPRIEARGVVASSTSTASALTAGSTSTGSLIQELVIGTDRYTDLREPTTIEVRNAVGVPIGRVHVLEKVAGGAADGVRQPADGRMASSLAVNALRVELFDLPATDLVNESGDIVVAHADTSAAFPEGVVCGALLPWVVGDAYLVSTPNVAPPVGVAQLGLVRLGATGGSEDATVATMAPLGAGTGQTSTRGGLSPLTAASAARAAAVSLLEGAITAKAVTATSTTTSGTSTGESVLTDLVVAGTNVCAELGRTSTCQPAANTVLLLDGGTTLVVLNEQSPGASDLRVNAVHIYVLAAGNPFELPVGAEVVISSAYSGTRA
ncbi:MAG TPA: choice-of-anchor P family protein [Mycobacteriales bacterium]|nr:choice-of-anchor P family protein [Mycobacteriales bacterium]